MIKKDKKSDIKKIKIKNIIDNSNYISKIKIVE